MREPLRIEVKNGGVVEIYGDYPANVYDWDTLPFGGSFVCPVCLSEFGEDQEADIQSILQRGHCLSCAPEWKEEVFVLIVWATDYENGAWSKVFRTEEAAIAYLKRRVAENWRAVAGEDPPESIGWSEIVLYMGMAEENFVIEKREVIE